MDQIPLEQDRGLPHGRAWVVERGCGCDECVAARERIEREQAAAEAARAPQLPRKRREANQRWARARWTKYRGRWVITEPPGSGWTQGQLVNVRNHTTAATKEVRLSHFAGEKMVETDTFVRIWYPAR